MSKSWTLARMQPQTGKRFLITGANSGVGYSAAVELARRGATVILACRDKARGEAALGKLRTEAEGPGSAASEAELVLLDLASLDSVQRVAEEELAHGLPLHGLINNAGVMAPPKRQETQDGFELQFGTNVLGHFALTCRLMRALQMGRGTTLAEAARVVTLSSIAHKRGKLNFDDLQSEQRYVPMEAYAQSKLADLMFSCELDRRCRAARLGILSIAVHPGVAQTNLFKVGSGRGLAGIAEKVIQKTIGTLLNSELGGAIPTLFAATAQAAKGGCYYGSQGFLEMRGGDVGPAKVAPQARDAEAQRRLWEVCEKLTAVGMSLREMPVA
jgi:NAD(P)-dependent dehydrogenase (short-subunit alcohol dehydrogenase family)